MGSLYKANTARNSGSVSSVVKFYSQVRQQQYAECV